MEEKIPVDSTYIHISTYCNRSCPWCCHQQYNSAFPRTVMDLNTLVRFYDRFRPRTSIYDGGEPTLVQNLEDYLEISRQNSRSTYVITNGSLFSAAISNGHTESELRKALKRFKGITLVISYNSYLLSVDKDLRTALFFLGQMDWEEGPQKILLNPIVENDEDVEKFKSELDLIGIEHRPIDSPFDKEEVWEEFHQSANKKGYMFLEYGKLFDIDLGIKGELYLSCSDMIQDDWGDRSIGHVDMNNLREHLFQFFMDQISLSICGNGP